MLFLGIYTVDNQLFENKLKVSIVNRIIGGVINGTKDQTEKSYCTKYF